MSALEKLKDILRATYSIDIDWRRFPRRVGAGPHHKSPDSNVGVFCSLTLIKNTKVADSLPGGSQGSRPTQHMPWH
jgi:hypothetical protein